MALIRKFAGALAAIGLATTAAITTASAADGAANDITATVVKDVTWTPDFKGEQTYVHHTFLLEADFNSLQDSGNPSSAVNKVDEGDWFTIQFNEVIDLYTQDFTIADIATCHSEREAKTIKCTFTAAAAQSQSVSGTLTAKVRAGQVTDQPHGIATAGTKEYKLPFPGGHVEVVPRLPAPNPAHKTVNIDRPNNQIRWQLAYSTKVAEPDAQLVIRDRLEGPHELALKDGKLDLFFLVDSTKWDEARGFALTAVEGSQELTVFGRQVNVNLDIDDDKSGFTLTMPNVVAADSEESFVTVTYLTAYAADTPFGVTFKNTGHIAGTIVTAELLYESDYEGGIDPSPSASASPSASPSTTPAPSDLPTDLPTDVPSDLPRIPGLPSTGADGDVAPLVAVLGITLIAGAAAARIRATR